MDVVNAPKMDSTPSVEDPAKPEAKPAGGEEMPKRESPGQAPTGGPEKSEQKDFKKPEVNYFTFICTYWIACVARQDEFLRDRENFSWVRLSIAHSNHFICYVYSKQMHSRSVVRVNMLHMKYIENRPMDLHVLIPH